MLEEHSVSFGRPDYKALKDEGWTVADMHFHSRYSDSFSSIENILALAQKRGTGVAITDHNLIAGVEKAYELKTDQFIVPGIEISSSDGPHILVYFYDLDGLKDYWTREVKPYLSKSRWLSISRSVEDIMNSVEGVNCVVSAAHPMGYLMEYRGIQQGYVKGRLSEEMVRRFDAYEVVGGSMSRSKNIRCREAADRFGLSYTGGTDGHVLGELGHIVTCSKAQDVEGFLNDIKNGRSSVVGKEEFFHTKFLLAMTSLANFMTCLPSSISHKIWGPTRKH